MITGLNTYLLTLPSHYGIFEEISIESEIEKFIRINGKRPKILIDVSTVIHIPFIEDHISSYLGGSYKIHTEKLKMVFNALSKRADLVFFFKKCDLDDEIQFFVPKMEKNYESSIELYQNFEFWSHTTKIQTEIEADKLNGSTSILQNLKKICPEYGEIRICYHRVCQEMAKYIKQNESEVFSIITVEEYFLAFEGSFEMWLLTRIDRNKMTINRYNRQNLFDALQLDREHLILLSAILQKRFFDDKMHKNFKNSLCYKRRYGEQRMRFILDYVRQFHIVDNRTEDPTKLFGLKPLYQELFGKNCTAYDKNIIKNGMRLYNLNFEIDESDLNDDMKCIKTEFPFVFDLLTKKVTLISANTFLSAAKCNSKNFTELNFPIFMKLLGILHVNKLNRPTNHLVCAKFKYDEPAKVTKEKIIYPELKVPPLSDLLFNQENFPQSQLFWDLFKWLLDLDDVLLEKVQKLDEKFSEYILVLITLRFLWENKEIDANESDGIFLTETFVRSSRWDKIKVNYPQKLNSRRIYLSHLYSKMYYRISEYMRVCGITLSNDQLLFDAVYFQSKMEEFDAFPKRMASEMDRGRKIYSPVMFYRN